MKRLILPLLLSLVGLGSGVGAGIFLRPPEMETPGAEAEQHAEEAPKKEHEEPSEYAKLNNQFIVPIVKEGKVDSMVIVSIAVEVDPGTTDLVIAREPKLRDEFLKVLFDHANKGSFDGRFTENLTLLPLRRRLYEVAREVVGPQAREVLISDIVRQDS